jgi:hypothetical protein
MKAGVCELCYSENFLGGTFSFYIVEAYGAATLSIMAFSITTLGMAINKMQNSAY